MSPVAKERLYRKYLKGQTVKDLSLEFGCLPQRVKAVIFLKHLYWEEVYPKLGEVHMRIAMEKEMMYAAEFPFVDYGCDLKVMGELEKGVQMRSFAETGKSDAKIKDGAPNETADYLKKMRSR